jgi:uncharacterized membrane protein HdeD (DUF308 family)
MRSQIGVLAGLIYIGLGALAFAMAYDAFQTMPIETATDFAAFLLLLLVGLFCVVGGVYVVREALRSPKHK